VGNHPSNLVDPKKIEAWYAKKDEELAASPEKFPHMAIVKEIKVARVFKDGSGKLNTDTVSIEPEPFVDQFVEDFDMGQYYFGFGLEDKLKAVAWSLLKSKIMPNICVWRRPIRSYGAKSLVSDPVDYFLTSSASQGERHLFPSLFKGGDEISVMLSMLQANIGIVDTIREWTLRDE